MIFHITNYRAWENALAEGKYTAPSLQVDGFIHCSTVDQVVDTANLFFKGQSGLILLCIDEKKLSAAIKYEEPSGGAVHDPNAGLFPHVYGSIDLDAVAKVIDFPSSIDGSFSLPYQITTLDKTP